MIVLDTARLKAKLKAEQPIEGATFTDVDWSDLDCESARFNDCLIEHAQYSNAIFTGATFSRCQFHRCRYSRSDLTAAAFEDCSFTVRDDAPVGCSFAFSDLRRARFVNCDLSFCEIERSDMFSVEMDRCNLRGARFHRVDFSQAFSRKVVVTRAGFRACNLELADLSDVRAAECEFVESRFREADLTGADLTGAILRGCDLFQADLTGAKLAGADLRGAEISGLNLLTLGSFGGMKINQNQQHNLLLGLGVDVYPESH